MSSALCLVFSWKVTNVHGSLELTLPLFGCLGVHRRDQLLMIPSNLVARFVLQPHSVAKNLTSHAYYIICMPIIINFFMRACNITRFNAEIS